MDAMLHKNYIEPLQEEILQLHTEVSHCDSISKILEKKALLAQLLEKINVYEFLVQIPERNIGFNPENTVIEPTPQIISQEEEIESKSIDIILDDNSIAQNESSKFKIPKLKSELISDEPLTPPLQQEVSKTKIAIDLNDKIFLISHLFKNDETAYQECISKLENCPNRQAANEYLSSEYHSRDWKKNDEAAQRLWSLVENAMYVR